MVCWARGIPFLAFDELSCIRGDWLLRSQPFGHQEKVLGLVSLVVVLAEAWAKAGCQDEWRRLCIDELFRCTYLDFALIEDGARFSWQGGCYGGFCLRSRLRSNMNFSCQSCLQVGQT